MQRKMLVLGAIGLGVLAMGGCKSGSGCGGSCGHDAAMSMPKKSLYERLGGAPAVEAVIDDFVGRAASDPKVNFTRKGTGNEWAATDANVAHLKMGLRDFVCVAAGGQCQYQGMSMKDAHRGMRISNAEFDALAMDLKATLDKFKVPAQEQTELLTAVEGTRKDIVERP